MRCTVSSSVTDQPVRQYRSAEIETKYVEVGDVRYAYREIGGCPGTTPMP